MNYIGVKEFNITLENEDLFREKCEEKNEEYIAGETKFMQFFKQYCINMEIDFTYDEEDIFKDEVADDLIAFQNEVFVSFEDIEAMNEPDYDMIDENIRSILSAFVQEKNIKEIHMNYKPQIFLAMPNIEKQYMDLVFIWQMSYK